MTQAELIEEARTHLRHFRDLKEAVEVATKTRFVEAAVVYFGADERNDYFQVILDRNTGKFIGASYSPQN
jgi:hypothetical protein